MSFVRTEFSFDDLFDLQPAPRRVLPFLDLRFRPRRQVDTALFRGAGLYAVLFAPRHDAAAELVYVGKYLGRRNDPSGGNVILSRWWTHAASLTMRGHRVSLNRATLDALPAALPPGHPFAALAGVPALLKDRGCQAGLNRVMFAAEHVIDFMQLEHCAATRARMRFAYLRIADPGGDGGQLRRRISEAEGRVIAALRPRCNREIAAGTHLPGIGQQRVLDEAEAALDAVGVRPRPARRLAIELESHPA